MYPFDFKTNPKIIDEMGIGVNKKKTHMSSKKSPVTSVIAPSKTIAIKGDSNEAANSKIPKAFKEHNLGSVNILAPGRPMAELAENRVYPAQGAYAKAIG